MKDSSSLLLLLNHKIKLKEYYEPLPAHTFKYINKMGQFFRRQTLQNFREGEKKSNLGYIY